MIHQGHLTISLSGRKLLPNKEILLQGIEQYIVEWGNFTKLFKWIIINNDSMKNTNLQNKLVLFSSINKFLLIFLKLSRLFYWSDEPKVENLITVNIFVMSAERRTWRSFSNEIDKFSCTMHQLNVFFFAWNFVNYFFTILR